MSEMTPPRSFATQVKKQSGLSASLLFGKCCSLIDRDDRKILLSVAVLVNRKLGTVYFLG